jgi:hypothetical protein
LLFKAGDTFLLPKTSDGVEHLWIVVTDPDINANAIGVNVTTRYSTSETTVVLMPGDHPFIKHESVIRFRDAKILELKSLEHLLSTGTTKFACHTHAPCSAELLTRVQEGMIKTSQLSNEVKDYFRAVMGI